jgi:predicted Zn-dependent protease
MRAKEEAFRILEAALSVASAGVDEAEVCLGGGDLSITNFANNLVAPSQESSLEVLTIRVGIKGKMLRLSTTDLSTQGLKEAALQAKNRAEHLPDRAEGVGLPEPQSYDLTDAYDPETELFRALERAAAAGRAIIQAHKNGLSAAGQIAIKRGSIGFDGSPGVYAIANTRGLLAYHPETRVSFRLALNSRGGASSWVEDESFTVSAIDVDGLVRSALKRALAPGEQRALEPGRHTVVLDNAAVGALIAPIGRLAGGGAFASGRSFLSNKIGASIAGTEVTLVDDHAHPLHRGRPFDLEGVAKKRVAIIENGVATSPVHSFESATRQSATPTGHRIWHPEIGETEAAQNLVLEGGSATLSDLIGSTRRGVLIGRLDEPEVIDPRRLILSTTSREGCFLIEGGEVVAPLESVRLTVSLLDLLAAVESRGSVAMASGSVVPSMKVELPLIPA